MTKLDAKQDTTTNYQEKALVWARDNRVTLTTDTDEDRNGDRVFIAMLRPWKQDKNKPYMWWSCAETLDDAVSEAINKCCTKGKHQDLDFGFRPWNSKGDAETNGFRPPPSR